MTKTFKIRLYPNGLWVDLGTFTGADEAEALDALAQSFGFASYDAACEAYGMTREEALAETAVTEVP